MDSVTNGGHNQIHSVWCDEKGYSGNGCVALAGRGVFLHEFDWNSPPSDMTKGYQQRSGSIYFNRIRGSAGNSIFAVGDWGIVLHYNGVNWRFYKDTFDYTIPRQLTSVSVTQNMVFIAGDDYSRGVIITGRRK